jgi:hypothetical protein
MALSAIEFSVQDPLHVNFDVQSQKPSVGSVNTYESAKSKTAAIKARYKSKISIAEQELSFLTNENDNTINPSQATEIKESASQAAHTTLKCETSLAFERVKAEEALGALWAAWSDVAEKKFTHRPQDQAIKTAFTVLLTYRRKIAAIVLDHIKNLEKANPNAKVPIWIKTEPKSPTELQPDAWWPKLKQAALDTEQTLTALLQSADRAIDLVRERLDVKSAVQAPAGTAFSCGSRGSLAFAAAKECQEGSTKILVALESAAADLKSHSRPAESSSLSRADSLRPAF